MAMASPTAAQSICLPERSAMLDKLSTKYQEQPVAMGIASTGHLIEVLTTEDGKTWTIIMSAPKGKTCMVAEGKDWRGGQARKIGEPGV